MFWGFVWYLGWNEGDKSDLGGRGFLSSPLGSLKGN